MKKQPKPKPCECWCLTQFDGTIWPGWCSDSREQARAWKHIMPDPGEIIRALAKKAEEIDEAVIFMRTRGFVGSMLAMCKHVLKELEALCKAKNELIDERDKLLRDMRVLVLASDVASLREVYQAREAELDRAGGDAAADAAYREIVGGGSSRAKWIAAALNAYNQQETKT